MNQGLSNFYSFFLHYFVLAKSATSSIMVKTAQVQCQHIIPTLNARADWAKYTIARPVATHIPGYGCIYDLTTERRFDL